MTDAIPQDPARGGVSEAEVEAALLSCARDDEGEMVPMFELLDFSGENAARTAMRAALQAAAAVCPDPCAALRAENEALRAEVDHLKLECDALGRAAVIEVGKAQAERGERLRHA